IIFMSYFILNFIIQFFIPNFKLNKFILPTIKNPSGTRNPKQVDMCQKDNDCGSRNLICIGGECVIK
ncbi:MAG: hypothetical protein AAB532_02960, partial [Patescibacteria group bacterium]